MYSFPDLEPVCCSTSSSNFCFLTCIQISQETGQVVWYSHIFKNFPQFDVIHTVKSFGIVNKAKVDVFLKLSWFLMIQQMLAISSLVPMQTNIVNGHLFSLFIFLSYLSTTWISYWGIEDSRKRCIRFMKQDLVWMSARCCGYLKLALSFISLFLSLTLDFATAYWFKSYILIRSSDGLYAQYHLESTELECLCEFLLDFLIGNYQLQFSWGWWYSLH